MYQIYLTFNGQLFFEYSVARGPFVFRVVNPCIPFSLKRKEFEEKNYSN